MRLFNIDKMNEKISGLLDYVNNPTRKSVYKDSSKTNLKHYPSEAIHNNFVAKTKSRQLMTDYDRGVEKD